MDKFIFSLYNALRDLYGEGVRPKYLYVHPEMAHRIMRVTDHWQMYYANNHELVLLTPFVALTVKPDPMVKRDMLYLSQEPLNG